MPVVELSVELPDVGLLTDGLVVVVPPVVDPPVEPPVEPVPVCASANVLASVSAAANPILMSFMISSSAGEKGKTIAPGYVSGVGIKRV
jgi:hypothetical protein